jgi:CheY-like chemotaxis protein
LLVDPENTISYTLKQILEGSGYRVSTAGTYPAASSILRQRAFDVVLTELDLERGAEGLRLALDAKQQQPAPVVILSVSKPSQEGLRSALGVANYLVFKPIDLGELQNALHTMVARRALQLAPE